MALSNILKEPRREITESLTGIVVFSVVMIPFAWADYLIAVHIRTVTGHRPDELLIIPLVFATGLLTICAMVAISVGRLFLLGTHALGEVICTLLEKLGIQMRPRQRY